MYWPELQTERFCVYTHVYRVIKNWGPGPYNSLRHADKRKYILGLSYSKSKGSTCVRSTWWGKWEKGGYVLAEKKVTLSWLMNSDMVKSWKFDHLHLVNHFTVPLKSDSNAGIFLWLSKITRFEEHLQTAPKLWISKKIFHNVHIYNVYVMFHYEI